MHSRTNHDVQMPLSRLPARDWQRIRSRNVAAASGISINTRTITLPFHAEHQTGEAQTRFLSRMRISNYGRRIRRRGLAVGRSSGRQPRGSKLGSAADGDFRFGRSTVRSTVSGNSEILAIPASTIKGVKQYAKNYAISLVR